MKLIFSYLRKYSWPIVFTMILKITAVFVELLLPFILEHLIDNVAPTQSIPMIIMWGVVMLIMAVLIRQLNLISNRRAVKTSSEATYEIRRDLFYHSVHLSGKQMDEFGLPSLISRMTADSYNLQDFIRVFQTIGTRAPLLLVGGLIVTAIMDPGLCAILCIVAPIAIVLILFVSFRGIPLYAKVQHSVDNIARVMRENITGVRVVKALSKEAHERERFSAVNEEMFRRERTAAVTMSLPGPVMTLFLNVGLTLVVFVGAVRVNDGLTDPGVILAFLTYFNMILMGIMGLTRVFLVMSKANASASRVAAVIHTENDLRTLSEEEAPSTQSDAFILFDDVSFRYGEDSKDSSVDSFAGGDRQMSLEHVSFSLKKGGSLGIIGPTGCGKTTIINLLMRFYDTTLGNIFIGGKDVRTYDKAELRSMFGAVFQNDVVFSLSLKDNIVFGRNVDDEALERAAEDACAAEFINSYDERFEYMAAIRGTNLSGGQRQRVLISRALAANPDILVLDDSSSALDYKTDAALRRAILEHHSDTTTIIVAQRVSSIMSLDHILVMDEGRIIGQGTHEELLRTCPQYLDIYKTQMGEEE